MIRKGACRSSLGELASLTAVVVVGIALHFAFPAAASSASKAPAGVAYMTVASQGGLLKDVGPLNPHAYRPNELFAQNWVYEGLVHYGPGGKVLPALAESWEIRQPSASDKRQVIVFKLRRGVLFHDGAPWSAQAAKANLDNILIEPLKSKYHGWYEFTELVESTKVEDDYTLSITFKQAHYPALQELTLIRPIRFTSPACLPAASNEKSCPPAAQTTDFWPVGETPSFKCVGVKCAAGTGPLRFVKKVTSVRDITSEQVTSATLAENEVVKEIHFAKFQDHWDKTAGGDVNNFVVKVLPSLDDVPGALEAGEIDMVFGLETIPPAKFKELHLLEDDHLNTYISDPLSTRYIMFNTVRAPTNSLAVRKAIIHAIDKQQIIDIALAGLEQPAYTLFPRNMPYCDVPLSPLLSYDPEKVRLALDAAGWPATAGAIRTKAGKQLEVAFLFRSSNTIQVETEELIQRHLATAGIRMTSIPAPDNDVFNSFNFNGTYHMAISAALGAPYDPHTTLSYLQAQPFNTSFASMSTKRATEGFALQDPMSKAQLDKLVESILTSTDVAARQGLYKRVLTAVHEQALFYPLSYQVNVAVVDNRFENFAFGSQQHDWPVHKLVDKRKLRAANAANSASATARAAGKDSAKLSKGAVAGIAVSTIVAVAAVVLVVFLAVRERKGKPVFAPLLMEDAAFKSVQMAPRSNEAV